MHPPSIRHYPGKILLFGEYTVLRDSQALAIPFNKITGYWTSENEGFDDFHDRISPYLKWIKDQMDASSAFPKVSLDLLKKDMNDGWQYKSMIPIGYGMGSSGAFAASIYHRYCQKNRNAIASVRMELAQLESYFHGLSSGLDPLVSWINQPILRLDENRFEKMPQFSFPSDWTVQLIDSGFARTTSKWVGVFNRKCEEVSFAQQIDRELIPLVEHAIHYTLQGAWQQAMEQIQLISDFQFHHFSEMIPETVSPLWLKLAQENLGYLKLCGAGGGGYFLLFGRKSESLEAALEGYKRVVIN